MMYLVMNKKKYFIKIGDVFGNLTVIQTGLRNKHNQNYVICRCSCGKETNCMPYSIASGKTKSCGCLKSIRLKKELTKYFVGSKLGKLTIIKDYHKYDDNGKRIFQFKCECGNIKDASVHYGMKSCGCLKRKSTTPEKDLYTRYKRNALKHNRKFDLSQEEFKSLILNDCHYCGSLPNIKLRVAELILHVGIDRINNDIGYNLSNCVSCCANCNYAKRLLSYNDFMIMIKNIYEKHNLQSLQV